MLTDTLNVTPQDFDADAVRWGDGAMRHLLNQISGTRAIITTDRQSGQTVIGALIIGIDADKGRYYLVFKTNGDAEHRVWLDDLGDVIVPMERGTAKWDAMRTYRAEQDAARRWAHTRHPKTLTGTLLVLPRLAAVRVVHSTDDGALDCWTVSLALLQLGVA